MTHAHDVSPKKRLEIANKKRYGAGGVTPYWLIERAIKRYRDPNPFALISSEVYFPIGTTDEIEAALFAAAWKHNAIGLRKKFGIEDTVSLFERFRPHGLIAPCLEGKNELAVYRGTGSADHECRPLPMSWTRSRKWAREFALGNRYIEPLIVSGFVPVSDILMALRGDEEREIVVRPGSVAETKRTRPRAKVI